MFADGVPAVRSPGCSLTISMAQELTSSTPKASVDLGDAADALDRVPTATGRMLEEIATGWPLATTAVVLALGVACLARLWWHALFAGLRVALVLLALVAVYYSSTYPIDWYLATSVERVVFSIVLGLTTVAQLLVVPG